MKSICCRSTATRLSYYDIFTLIAFISGSTYLTTELREYRPKKSARNSTALMKSISTATRLSSHVTLSLIILISGSTRLTTAFRECWPKKLARKSNALKKSICCRLTAIRLSSHLYPGCPHIRFYVSYYGAQRNVAKEISPQVKCSPHEIHLLSLNTHSTLV